MDRRTLLALTGSTTLGAVAGCIGAPTGGGDSDSDSGPTGNIDSDLTIPDSPEEYPVDDPGDRTAIDFAPSDTYTEIELGSRDGVEATYGPHAIRVMNFASHPEISVGVIDVLNEDIVHDESHEIPEYEDLKLQLLTPSLYVVNVRLSELDAEHTVNVPCGYFDCNDSNIKIGVFSDEEIASVVSTTLADCPGYPC